MTTTLRPAGPETRGADGVRARTYTVCVNSRPVGGVELRVTGRLGPTVGTIGGLTIDEADRRRGRGAVAALAGEEVLRSWGCTRAEVSVPPDAAYALRLAASLGYLERNRKMVKDLGERHALPPGSTVRPLDAAEYGPWLDPGYDAFVSSLTDIGVSLQLARAREARTRAELLPHGVPVPGTALLGIDHDGVSVGFLWLKTREPAWVFSVAVDAAHRGRGHGRTAMLAAENHCLDAGVTSLGLNVFADNTAALNLYESLGYRSTVRRFTKPLV